MKKILSLLLCTCVINFALLEAMNYRHMNPHRKDANKYNNTKQGKKTAKLRLTKLEQILYAPQTTKQELSPLSSEEIKRSLPAAEETQPIIDEKKSSVSVSSKLPETTAESEKDAAMANDFINYSDCLEIILDQILPMLKDQETQNFLVTSLNPKQKDDLRDKLLVLLDALS